MSASPTTPVGAETHAGAGASRVVTLVQKVAGLEKRISDLEASVSEFKTLLAQVKPFVEKYGKGFGLVIR